MSLHLLVLATLLGQGELPLPVPQAATPAHAAAAGPDLPAEVLALLPPGRTPVEARQADLDLDGAPEWIVVSRYLHPTRLDHGPRSAEWRAGQRIESRLTHELTIFGRDTSRDVGRVQGAPAIRYAVELSGNERQALLVEPLLGADGKKGRWPVVLTGARACAGACGPVEVHLVVWDHKARAFQDYAYLGAELVVLGSDGAAELWFADRRPGDPICCPSGYTVTRVGMYGLEVDTLSTRQVSADKMRKVLPPGGLIFRGAPAAPVSPAATPAAPSARPTAPSPR